MHISNMINYLHSVPLIYYKIKSFYKIIILLKLIKYNYNGLNFVV
jgi:hypothetical protein